MKVNIYINGYFYGESVQNQVERIEEEFSKLGVETPIIKTNSLPCFIKNGEIYNRFEADFGIYLDKDIHISKMLEKCGVKLYNSSRSIELCDDKILTFIFLADNGIKMPLTISSPLMYTESFDAEYYRLLESEIKYPIVIKEAFGSMGKQIYLANSRMELFELREKLKLKPHLYQEFISSSWGKDFRFLVIGKKVTAIMERKNENDFRSNIAIGGVGKNIEIADMDNRYVAMAEKACELLKLDYAGVDIMTGSCGEPILCEINSNAFFKKIEEVSGKNIAKTFCEYVLMDFLKKM